MATKADIIMEALKSGFHTMDELATKSEASLSTVKMQIGWLLPKKGFKIIKEVREGREYFKIG